MTTRAQIHTLVDSLPEDQLDAVRRSLEALHNGKLDPVLRWLMAAPADQDAYSASEHEATDRAWAGYQKGEYEEWDAFKSSLPDG